MTDAILKKVIRELVVYARCTTDGRNCMEVMKQVKSLTKRRVANKINKQAEKRRSTYYDC